MAEVMKEGPAVYAENEFSKANAHSDVVLIVDGRQLHVSKVILSIVSPAFDAMFQNMDGKSAEIQLSGKKYVDVVEFLRCIYPQVTKPVSDEWLEVLLILADEYQCSVVRDRCLAFLQNKLKDGKGNRYDAKPALRYLRIADKLKLPEALLKQILRFIIDSTQFLLAEKEAEYQELEIHVQKRLLRAYVLKAEKGSSFFSNDQL